MGVLKTNALIIHNGWLYVETHGILATNLLWYAGWRLKTGNIGQAGIDLQDASAEFGLLFHEIADISSYTKDNWYWVENNWPTVAELNIGTIIDAMSAATPLEVMYFVGIVDAMRQSVWNQPFEHEFFAALARAFTR